MGGRLDDGAMTSLTLSFDEVIKPSAHAGSLLIGRNDA